MFVNEILTHEYLIAEGAQGFEQSLNDHQMELSSKLVQGLLQSGTFQKVVEVLINFLGRQLTRVLQQGGQVVGNRAPAGILEVDHVQTVPEPHQIPDMIIAVTKDAGKCRQSRRNAAAFFLEPGELPFPELTIIPQVVSAKECKLPVQLFLVEGQAGCFISGHDASAAPPLDLDDVVDGFSDSHASLPGSSRHQVLLQRHVAQVFLKDDTQFAFQVQNPGNRHVNRGQ